jgi:hypothetical protein
MQPNLYSYTFRAEVPVEEIEATLVLTLFALESLYGEAQVRLDAAHHLDIDQRRCVIDASTEVGRSFNKVFTGFLHREFGADAFSVERVCAAAEAVPAG